MAEPGQKRLTHCDGFRVGRVKLPIRDACCYVRRQTCLTPAAESYHDRPVNQCRGLNVSRLPQPNRSFLSGRPEYLFVPCDVVPSLHLRRSFPLRQPVSSHGCCSFLIDSYGTSLPRCCRRSFPPSSISLAAGYVFVPCAFPPQLLLSTEARALSPRHTIPFPSLLPHDSRSVSHLILPHFVISPSLAAPVHLDLILPFRCSFLS